MQFYLAFLGSRQHQHLWCFEEWWTFAILIDIRPDVSHFILTPLAQTLWSQWSWHFRQPSFHSCKYYTLTVNVSKYACKLTNITVFVFVHHWTVSTLIITAILHSFTISAILTRFGYTDDSCQMDTIFYLTMAVSTLNEFISNTSATMRDISLLGYF